MIKEQLKCPKCGKVLLRGYSAGVVSVTCNCGCVIRLKEHTHTKGDKHYVHRLSH